MQSEHVEHKGVRYTLVSGAQARHMARQMADDAKPSFAFIRFHTSGTWINATLNEIADESLVQDAGVVGWRDTSRGSRSIGTVKYAGRTFTEVSGAHVKSLLRELEADGRAHLFEFLYRDSAGAWGPASRNGIVRGYDHGEFAYLDLSGDLSDNAAQAQGLVVVSTGTVTHDGKLFKVTPVAKAKALAHYLDGYTPPKRADFIARTPNAAHWHYRSRDGLNSMGHDWECAYYEEPAAVAAEPAVAAVPPAKARWSLLPWRAVAAVVEVMTHGAAKHGDTGYKSGRSDATDLDAALRHIAAYAAGPKPDPETGLHSLAHAAARLLMIVERYEAAATKGEL